MKFLTRDEEADLIASWRTRKDERSVAILVKAFTPLVKRVVKKFRHGSVSMEDLMQEGFVGFLKALEKFDPENGNRLAVYAQWWILAQVTDAVIAQTGPVHPGTGTQRRRMFFTGENRFSAVSLDEPLPGTENLTFADTIPSNDAGPDEIVQDATDTAYWNARLSEAVAGLPERDRKIINTRWLSEGGATLDELGAELGISKERVRQLETRSIAELSRRLRKTPERASA